MHTNGYQRLSWSGILAAAAGLLAQQGHASGWCPSSTSYQITCSNCSRELTCDVNGIDIEIHGTNVTLDGQGYSINNSPNIGVAVYNNISGGAEATIQNLNIIDPGSAGIYFEGGVSSNWANVNYVFVSGAPNSGIHHNSWNPLGISNSWTYDNGTGVFGSYASSTAYTDFLSSSAQGNTEGYNPATSPGSWVRDSFFWNNSSVGANISYAENMLVDNNSFSSGSVGLNIYSSDGTTITNNSGGLNSPYDCVHDGFSSTSASGNTWNTYSGSGCVF